MSGACGVGGNSPATARLVLVGPPIEVPFSWTVYELTLQLPLPPGMEQVRLAVPLNPSCDATLMVPLVVVLPAFTTVGIAALHLYNRFRAFS